MPELYEGQAVVVASKLRQAEMLQEADEADADAARTMPDARAAILRRMAGRMSLIINLRSQLQRINADPAESAEGDERNADDSETNREESLRIRLSRAEKDQLSRQAAEQGLTVAAYVRLMCGLS